MVLRVVYSPICASQGGIFSHMCLSGWLTLSSHGPQGVNSPLMVLRVVYVPRCVPQGGVCATLCTLGKPHRKAGKPATESHFAQGQPECEELSFTENNGD